MSIKSREKYWALSSKLTYGRSFLGRYCWEKSNRPHGLYPVLFETRKEAKKAQKTCCYHETRVERVHVTIEIIE